MKRAVRFDNQEALAPINDVDMSQLHKVYVPGRNSGNSRKSYGNSDVYAGKTSNYASEVGSFAGSFATNFVLNYANHSITENGASGLKTTGHPLLDLNFKVSSLRNRSEKEIVNLFIKAYYDDRIHAVKWLFFLRDILEGMGERRTFRICLTYLAVSHPKEALAVMELVPEYGRYDDLLAYIDTPLCSEACAFIKKVLDKDIASMNANRPVSLLAKWLPSNNTSSETTRRYARIIAGNIGLSDRQYRKMLSSLRAYLDVVERKISASEWTDVDYAKVSAKANLKYDNAFARHDSDRRAAYLKEVSLGDSNLNISGLMPYEIVHRFMKNKDSYFEFTKANALKDDFLAELMWQKIVEEGFNNEWGLDDCIVVADGSGSMFANVTGSTSIRAIEVCNSLAIYFAAQLKGVFHDKAITFSERPQFINLAKGKSLKEKLEIMFAHDEVANTNIEAVFDILLKMAVGNHIPAEEMPKQVLIISDMEFDEARGAGYGYNRRNCMESGINAYADIENTLFTVIARKYEMAGYVMPRLIFWNVCGRTDTIPMADSESGLCLLSGFSQNAMKVASHKEVKDPYESLLKTLDSVRYERVEKALGKIA